MVNIYDGELAGKTRDELNVIAREFGIPGYRRKSKEELIEILQTAKSISDQDQTTQSWWGKYHNHVYGWASIIGLSITILGVMPLFIGGSRKLGQEGIVPGLQENKYPLYFDETRIGNLAVVKADSRLMNIVATYSHTGVDLVQHIFDQQAIAGINGPPYSKDKGGKPLGMLYSKGMVYQDHLNPLWSGCFLSNCASELSGNWIGYCKDMPVNDLSTCETALQTQFIIVEPNGSNGIKKRIATKLAARSAICLGEGDDVYFVATELEKGQAGIPMYDFGKLLSTGDDQIVPCTVGINLDGGRATAMVLRNSYMNTNLRWSFGPSQGSSEDSEQWNTPIALFAVPK